MFSVLQFPHLETEGWTKTSHPDAAYNCIAWAANDQVNWWWPTGKMNGKAAYWPRTAPKKETIGAFERAFELRGYKRFKGGTTYEAGYEKVAIYAVGTEPKHAARQLADGFWTHKMGDHIDIRTTLKGVEGPEYGRVVRVLRKKLPRNT